MRLDKTGMPVSDIEIANKRNFLSDMSSCLNTYFSKEYVFQVSEETSTIEEAKDFIEKSIDDEKKYCESKNDNNGLQLLQNIENKLDSYKILNLIERKLFKIIRDQELLKDLNCSPKDIVNQFLISQQDFKDLKKDIQNEKQPTLDNLYKKFNGWNLDEGNKDLGYSRYFDCYYNSLLVTIKEDLGGRCIVDPNVCIFPDNINKNYDYIAEIYIDFPIRPNLIEEKFNNTYEAIKENLSFDSYKYSNEEEQDYEI